MTRQTKATEVGQSEQLRTIVAEAEQKIIDLTPAQAPIEPFALPKTMGSQSTRVVMNSDFSGLKALTRRTFITHFHNIADVSEPEKGNFAKAAELLEAYRRKTLGDAKAKCLADPKIVDQLYSDLRLALELQFIFSDIETAHIGADLVLANLPGGILNLDSSYDSYYSSILGVSNRIVQGYKSVLDSCTQFQVAARLSILRLQSDAAAVATVQASAPAISMTRQVVGPK